LLISLCAWMLMMGSAASPGESHVQVRDFGTTAAGQKAVLYTLKGKDGIEVELTNFGATLVSLKVLDRKGTPGDVVLGYDNVEGYERGKAYIGATVGRYANRIANGKFALADVTYTLAKNNGDNSLHGGVKGFNSVIWQAEEISTDASTGVQFEYLSRDGEEGYPGNLDAKVTYTLAGDELRIAYDVTTDRKTVQNLTNHSYFNLTGKADHDILSHELMLTGERFTPVDATLIPTGELRPVQGTPFDFRKPTPIGARINQDDEQLKLGRGYDHNWVLGESGKMKLAARVYEPVSGRVLEVSTTEPGVQFYTGNFLDGSEHGKHGQAYARRTAFCLETQHYPDSPNHPQFPSTVLNPRQHYRSETILKFSTR